MAEAPSMVMATAETEVLEELEGAAAAAPAWERRGAEAPGHGCVCCYGNPPRCSAAKFKRQTCTSAGSHKKGCGHSSGEASHEKTSRDQGNRTFAVKENGALL